MHSSYYYKAIKHIIFSCLTLMLSSGVVSCEQATPITNQAMMNAPQFKANTKIDEQEFWRIIDFSKKYAAGNSESQEALLVKIIAQYSPSEIIEFECLLRQRLEEADDFNVMAAEKIMEGSVTDDSYIYFRCWLIAQGEKVFTEAIRSPDTLAAVAIDEAETDFEQLLYVATDAYKISTGKKEEDASFPRNIAAERGLNYDFASETKGKDWIPEQLPSLLPKLWAKFN